MPDSLRRFHAIRQALITMYPKHLPGRTAHHLHTLAAMINGIVGTGKVHLSAMAEEMPDARQAQSRIKQYSRFVQNKKVDLDTYLLPFIAALLEGIARSTLILAIDTSRVGGGCTALMISLIHKKRAIPLCWQVTKNKKGHLPAHTQTALLDQLKPHIPTDKTVIVVGDGEFDSVELLTHLAQQGWYYVCRTDYDNQLLIEGRWHRFEQLHPDGTNPCRFQKAVRFTHKHLHGPVSALCYWDRAFERPLYLLTNMPTWQKAYACYKKRVVIETFFSDQKSRGFHIHKSHIAEPKRLCRLLMAACLAYIWIIYLGQWAHQNGLRRLLDRADRNDLGLFQLGLKCLKYLIHRNKVIPVNFYQLNVCVR